MSVPTISRDRALPIAVIGAGFSGTMAAIQLLDALPRDRTILLCERGGRFGRGLAFGLANGLSELSEELSDTTLQMVRNVPHLSLKPLVIIWSASARRLSSFSWRSGCSFRSSRRPRSSTTAA